MKTKELRATIEERAGINARMKRYTRPIAIQDYPDEQRAEIDRLSARFAELRAAIVAGLKERGGEITFGGVSYQLTKDRLAYVALDPLTRLPKFEPYMATNGKGKSHPKRSAG